jgi:hypothetical protein
MREQMNLRLDNRSAQKSAQTHFFVSSQIPRLYFSALLSFNKAGFPNGKSTLMGL